MKHKHRQNLEVYVIYTDNVLERPTPHTHHGIIYSDFNSKATLIYHQSAYNISWLQYSY